MPAALFRTASFLVLSVASASVFAAEPATTANPPACCEAAKPATATTPATPEAKVAPAGHPLRGVIVAVMTEKQALLVKHEEIPGVMRAMTMLLKVDAATLAAAKKDQTITATLVRQDDGWWLRDVRPAAPDA